MAEFPHDHIKPFSAEGKKKEQVGEMFNKIAGRYDFMNRFLSAGIDKTWRKKAIRYFKEDHPKTLLDVATGTADMALLAAKELYPVKITGIDISENMLEKGRQKVKAKDLVAQIELYRGDAETIIFPDDTFDGVMVAFGVRNFEHLEAGLKEILRVLRPGAQIVVLEFSKPQLPLFRGLYNFYMGSLAPWLAGLFRQNKQAYQYLNESAKAFPDRDRFLAILQEAGFSVTKCKPLSLGICCIYSGRKPLT